MDKQIVLSGYPNKIEREDIENLMGRPNIVRCKALAETNVLYCSSPEFSKDKPPHMSDVAWRMCPYYRLRDICTKDPEACKFYPDKKEAVC